MATKDNIYTDDFFKPGPKLAKKSTNSTSEESSVFRRDVANAALFARMHEGYVLWVADQEVWYAWDGQRFLEKNNGEVMRRARITVRHMYEEAMKEEDSDKRKAKIAWALHSESKLEKMISYAQSEPALEARKFEETFDSDPYLFNCANGVLDLRTGKLSDHDPKYRITKLSPIACGESADCPEFSAWLALTCKGDGSLVEYLLRFMGYCLSGLTQEQCFWLFYGPTKTGKSTFIKILRGLMGDYATTLPEAAVVVNRFANQEHALAELAGVRLATLVEIRQGARYDEAKLKQITGQDRIGASKKYMNYFEFESHAKLAMAVNDRPTVRDTGDAFWNRVKPVPFTAFVKPESRIPNLDLQFLNSEGPAIVALAASAFRRWHKNGLVEPDAVTSATKEYRDEQDVVAEFIDDECVRDSNSTEESSKLYKAFCAWKKSNDYQVGMTKTRFGIELKRLAFEPVRDGVRRWKGLYLVHPANAAKRDENTGGIS